MKVKAIAFANSVKAGESASEQMFLSAHGPNGAHCWDIEIENNTYVRCTEVRTGAVVYTSLYNTKWWLPEENKAAKKVAPKKTAVKL